MQRFILSFLCGSLIPWGGEQAFSQIRFNDASRDSHIDFVHEDGADDEGYLVSLMAGGLGLLDYDNDGLIDAYFLNGHQLPVANTSLGNQLYRNLGSAQFQNTSASSYSDCKAFSLGIAVADIDNDGFQDIALSNFGSISILHNQGDGTFEDVTAAVGLANSGIAFGAGVAFLDIENDGDVDLYVADYVDFSFDGFQEVAAKTYPYPPGPDHYAARPDHLFKNNGEGTFEDHSLVAGISQISSPSMGVVCGDFDDDNDTDIFVCSDAESNLLFINDGLGLFTQDAELLAVAYNARGVPVGSMGAEAADIDGDGLEDLFITDYSAQMPILFRNLGEYGFADISTSSRAGRDVVPHANWGAGLADFDNDGDRDLMIGNGHLFKWAHKVEQLTDFKVRNCLLENDGRGRFTNVTEQSGGGMDIVESTRGLAFDDIDNDGDIDAIALNSDASANVLVNQTESGHHWIQVILQGETFNRDGIGAKVTIEGGGKTQVAEMRSGRGYQSSYASRLHFGLGDVVSVDRIVVDWLGDTTEYKNPKINTLHTLRQKGSNEN